MQTYECCGDTCDFITRSLAHRSLSGTQRHRDTHTRSSHRCSLSIPTNFSYTHTKIIINWTSCIFNIISHSCCAEPIFDCFCFFLFVSVLSCRIFIFIIAVVVVLSALHSHSVWIWVRVHTNTVMFMCVYVCFSLVSFIFIVFISFDLLLVDFSFKLTHEHQSTAMLTIISNDSYTHTHTKVLLNILFDSLLSLALSHFITHFRCLWTRVCVCFSAFSCLSSLFSLLVQIYSLYPQKKLVAGEP